jgi:hypothetical protein
VQAGSLLAPVRLPVPVAPTYGVGTLVVRDADEPAVARAAARHAALREVLQRAPLSLRFSPEPGLHPLDEEPSQPQMERLAELMAVGLVASLQARWKEVRALAAVLGEIGEELGDDPVHPETRERLERCERRLMALRDSLVASLGAIELPEPDEQEDVRPVRELALQLAGRR